MLTNGIVVMEVSFSYALWVGFHLGRSVGVGEGAGGLHFSPHLNI